MITFIMEKWSLSSTSFDFNNMYIITTTVHPIMDALVTLVLVHVEYLFP